MDSKNRTAQRDYDNLLPTLANAIRADVPRVRQIAQIAGVMGDEELAELAGSADFPIGNRDKISWLINGGYLSGFRIREWVCECLQRNNKFVAPAARAGIDFALEFAKGQRTWQELFGMAQTIEAIEVPRLTNYEIRDWGSDRRLRHKPQTYMTYAIARALSNGNDKMIDALKLSRMASAAVVKENNTMALVVNQQEYEDQIRILCKYLRVEAAWWAR